MIDTSANAELLRDVRFSHLHNHSQFSILQATSQVGALVKKAAEYKMPAVALTDNGNMMAAFHFVRAVSTGHFRDLLSRGIIDPGKGPFLSHT